MVRGSFGPALQRFQPQVASLSADGSEAQQTPKIARNFRTLRNSGNFLALATSGDSCKSQLVLQDLAVMTSVTREMVHEALTRGMAAAGKYRALLAELDRCNSELTKEAINLQAGMLSNLDSQRLSEAHPRHDIVEASRAALTFRRIHAFCDHVDRWVLEDLKIRVDKFQSNAILEISLAAQTLDNEMRDMARNWGNQFSAISEEHVKILFDGRITGYKPKTDRAASSLGKGGSPVETDEARAKDCHPTGHSNLGLDGPRIPRLAQLRFDLVDEGGNRGCFEEPEIHVELIFGSGQRILDQSRSALLEIKDCRIRISHHDGEIEEALPGSQLKYLLHHQVGEAGATESIELAFEPMAMSKGLAEWYSVYGAAHRKLYGKSGLEYLCTFTKRPSQLQIFLEAEYTDFRLVEAETKPGQRPDLVDRVKAALARIATLGRPDSGGFYILDTRRIIG